MTARLLGGRLALPVVLALLAWSPASAQDSAESEEGEATSSEISGENLSSKQKVDFVEGAEAGMATDLDTLLKMVEEAVDKNDIILLTCLNEKYPFLKQLYTVVVDAKTGLQEAIARENADLEEHHFRRAFIAQDQGKTVAAEAEACVSQVGTSFPGQTRVVLRYQGPEDADQDFGAASSASTRASDASPLRAPAEE
jgi:hypothetical protein